MSDPKPRPDALTESIKRARERMAGRLDRQIAENKPLLDRLAREGDCLACVGTEHGCDRHNREARGE